MPSTFNVSVVSTFDGNFPQYVPVTESKLISQFFFLLNAAIPYNNFKYLSFFSYNIKNEQHESIHKARL